MTKARILAVTVLFLAPFAFMMGVGGYHLYSTGWGFVAWWPMALSITAAYGLAWYWTRKSGGVLPITGVAEAPAYWTDRDRQAWQIVETKAAALVPPTAEPLTQTQAHVPLPFPTASLHEPGRYLVELNSGRLKVGAARYRELMAAQEAPPTQQEGERGRGGEGEGKPADASSPPLPLSPS